MPDRVDKFIEDFQSAIDARRRYSKDSQLITGTTRRATKLAADLDRLARIQGMPRMMDPADLRALAEELTAWQQQPALDSLVTNGRALLRLVEDGIIDGDAVRIQALLAEAESVSRLGKKLPPSGPRRLNTHAKARCMDCQSDLIGRGGSVNWGLIAKRIRDHEREQHGTYTSALGDELRRGLQGLRGGSTRVKAGRYEVGQL